MTSRLRITSAMTAACLLVASVHSQAAGLQGGNPNPGIAPPHSQVLGKSYDEWAILSAQWFNSFPFSTHPSPALTVGNMLIAPQLSFEGEITVPVTMKAGDWFFMPILFNVWANAPGDPGYGLPWDIPFTDPSTGVAYPTYEAWVREFMRTFMDSFEPACSIDGEPIENVDLYRMQTSLFNLIVPDDNLWLLPAGDYSPGLMDGWFAILRPMTPGRHTVSSSFLGNTITYEITVKPAKK